MRLTYSQIKDQHYRNINLVGNDDENILADFQYNLGRRYQIALAKLANYRTTVDATFLTGMNVTLLSSGVTQVISGITSSSTTATVTTSAVHGYSNGNLVSITGASPAGYNGTYTITVTSPTTFTYTLLEVQIATSATSSQFYPMPLGEVTIEGMYITIGAVNYPLEIVTNRLRWQQLNAILIQPTAYPRYYFPDRDKFGLWPIPQTSYTGTISYRYRDRNLLIEDITGGEVTVTYGSSRLTGDGGIFTPAMVGRWFTITDTAVPGQGYWYRVIDYIDNNTLTLNDTWRNETASTTGYIIGESPEIPEDLHNIFAWGTASDFYSGMRKDPVNGQLFDNLYWTGNPGNTNRKQGDSNVSAGLLGGMSSYADRDNRHLVKKKYNVDPLIGIIWGASISE